MLYDVIEIYKERKLKELISKKDEDIIAIKVKDKNYKALRELKNSTDGKCAGLISLSKYKFTSAIEDKIAEVRSSYNKAVKSLNDLLTEVVARCEYLTNVDEVMGVLTSYGIVSNGKINA